MPELIVHEKEGEQKIERFLLRRMPKMPRAHIFKLIRTRKININGKKAKIGQVVKPGDTIRIYIREEQFQSDTLRHSSISEKEADALPQPEVIYEDNSFIVVNKPAGVASHGGEKSATDNMLLRVQKHTGTLLGNTTLFKPSLVHRLDRNTSGVLVFAKNLEVTRKVAQLLKSHSAQKIYIALVAGKPPQKEATLTAPVFRRDLAKYGREHETTPPTGITKYKMKERIGEYTLLELQPLTGKTHQLRAHMLHIGCPIAGDPLYGDEKTNSFLKKHFGFTRQFLHAYSIMLTHPETGKEITFTAPLTEEIERLLATLRATKASRKQSGKN